MLQINRNVVVFHRIKPKTPTCAPKFHRVCNHTKPPPKPPPDPVRSVTTPMLGSHAVAQSCRKRCSTGQGASEPTGATGYGLWGMAFGDMFFFWEFGKKRMLTTWFYNMFVGVFFLRCNEIYVCFFVIFFVFWVSCLDVFVFKYLWMVLWKICFKVSHRKVGRRWDQKWGWNPYLEKEGNINDLRMIRLIRMVVFECSKDPCWATFIWRTFILF